MDDPHVILLSLDADAAITRVSSSVEVSTDFVFQQAQKFVRATLGTEVGGLVFFVLNEPIEINEKSIMATKLGHFSYKWIRWTKGTLREVLKTNANIELVQVVAIRAREFNELPPREFLPELPGGRYFQGRPPKAPSSGAEPKEFAQSQENEKTRIHIDRPRMLNNTSVPIALLVPSFGNFQTNIKNVAPSDRAMLFATKMANELCVIFRDEQERKQKFCLILSEFLGEDVSNVTIGDFKTDGGVIHEYTAVNMNGAPRLFIKVKLAHRKHQDHISTILLILRILLLRHLMLLEIYPSGLHVDFWSVDVNLSLTLAAVAVEHPAAPGGNLDGPVRAEACGRKAHVLGCPTLHLKLFSAAAATNLVKVTMKEKEGGRSAG
ncbi:hypothetical protein F5877DRAFT_70108 [Lentinula edodes]|nr:hypothetical protein F5877DRAFT_70108 [Lentinula edodes]